ncbi:MAG: FecR domain-containing protein [Gloeobacteraceae cyanobacterium ES-bin-144]|nr:FecR domain-containing protein [Verrucomicrobiales bacterium]
MREEPRLIDLYRQYALLHHVLCEEFEGQHALDRPIPQSRRFSPFILIGLAAAAALALLVVVNMRSSAIHSLDSAPYSTAVFSEDAVWSIQGEQHSSGQSARISQGSIIRLQEGQARLTLKSNAVAVIDGSTELEYVTDEFLRLGHGRGRFRVEEPGVKLTVATSTLTAVDLGTEFGVESHPGKPDEVDVFEGSVDLWLVSSNTHQIIKEGNAVRVMAGNTLEQIPVSMPPFPHAAPKFIEILKDRFDKPSPTSVYLNNRKPLHGNGAWLLTYGKPSMTGTRLEGENFAAHFKLPERSPTQDSPILLATMETLKPLHGEFHTEGWAGMSFYLEGKEVLFFGDGYGSARTWSIDVKQHLPIVLPSSPVIGARTVTLSYNRNTGAASLHEGALPLGPAFVSGELPKGMEFDEIRIGASAGASLALHSLTVRIGESGE